KRLAVDLKCLADVSLGAGQLQGGTVARRVQARSQQGEQGIGVRRFGMLLQYEAAALLGNPGAFLFVGQVVIEEIFQILCIVVDAVNTILEDLMNLGILVLVKNQRAARGGIVGALIGAAVDTPVEDDFCSIRQPDIIFAIVSHGDDDSVAIGQAGDAFNPTVPLLPYGRVQGADEQHIYITLY